ncbi:MAG TPA: hypothetical protein VNZ64_12630 [Candidatus Acidoferrum sp.]|jgi:hypothetical protein|nr:hypothetical protein [Candidatus Acidoferrum sp.]
MRTLLQHTPSGKYFQSLEKWTSNPKKAHDFGLIARAMRFAQKARFPHMALVLSFDRPEESPAFIFEAAHSDLVTQAA